MRTSLSILLLVIGLAGGPEGCGLFAPATYDISKYQSVHEVALDGDLGKLKALLEVNPQLVNVSDYDKNTPLHLAAVHNHADAVGLILDNGANMNAQNSSGMTPLHLAAKQGFIDVVRVILSRGPDLNIQDSRGWTPLIWAEKTHHEEIAHLLRESGAHS